MGELRDLVGVFVDGVTVAVSFQGPIQLSERCLTRAETVVELADPSLGCFEPGVEFVRLVGKAFEVVLDSADGVLCCGEFFDHVSEVVRGENARP